MITADSVKLPKKKHNFPPALKIMLGFALLIAAGTLLLCLPFSQKSALPFRSVLFTATSAVCVAGLSVVNIAESFTLFGQFVIMFLIQFGGLGFMTLTTLIFMAAGKKITLKERVALSEAYNEDGLQGLLKLTKTIILYTAVIEAAGTLLLSFVFIPSYGFSSGIYYALFHSVSAFCNAGIDVLPNGIPPYGSNIIFNLSAMMLIFLGGLGFAVMRDIIRNKTPKKFSFNTKLVLYMSAALILGSSVLFLITEGSNYAGHGGKTFGERVLLALFQAVTSRTAGFSTVNQADLSGASKLITMLNMFVGASPGSTGGGIKTTTFFIIAVYFTSGLKGRHDDITALGKSFSQKTVQKALLLFLYALAAMAIFTVLLMVFEHNSGLGTEALLFEAVSAFATVGLSLGITAELSAASQFLIIAAMFAGRLGAPVLGLFYMLSHQKESFNIRYPEAKVIVG